ncbi:MAG: hypothetical protein A2977_00880 [Alphaproteobacteria bacterium RIFCSPLOWO2_01_FULL_45_8]|nr:MAG: hypothetical protein A2065_01620 [Alphaproteobacteria bacterium GWB1_45_5]OFW75903.1 MAG: hypothetical protein A3K20_03705 [Alphaproteobacteria bacterium GWA1_45_9]OFW89996.1 MAG: hypothetical protein A2621_03910 [Alphaproteobacteria bacterium RIFCSPHIGHO2_01_FULL_41_14]OFW95958.1 MAG: hypothetical protein A2977_00880 [Alphaproteobacteria bacterium RIFCSPLOWO2_01_FULL_45_8]HCI48812.1 hypothetical protein [Holosporales bacterium]
MAKFLLAIVVFFMGVFPAMGMAESKPEDQKAAYVAWNQKKAAHFRINGIGRLIQSVKTPQAKFEVYSLWIDSLKLEIEEADQALLSGIITQSFYETLSKQISTEMKKVAHAAKKLGYTDSAKAWEELARQYRETKKTGLEK